MAVPVAAGVWWLEHTRGCNVYLARARDGSCVLVDAGFRSSARAIIQQARTLADGAPVTHVLLTHDHFDHVGAAAEVARALDARIALGVGDCERAADGGWQVEHEPLRTGRLQGLAQRLLPPLGPDAPVPVHDPIEGPREVAPGIQAVPAPGHTPGSTCYVAVEAGVAFVGDLVISHRNGLARSLAAANRDDGQYLRTLREFAAGAPEVGLAGHGYPVRHGFREALQALADAPREPLSLRNAWRRGSRMARFSTFLWMADQPRRR